MHMHRHLATSALAAGLGAVLLVGSGCGSDSDPGSSLEPDAQAACAEYSQIVNDWSRDYGAEVGAVGEAQAGGDEDRQEEAVETVRGLFQNAANDLRAQAGTVSDEELAGGLTEAADGLTEIAEQIETYDDVEAAPDLMAEGQFAAGGEKVNQICAG
jgi:hypothetical protein